MNVKIYYNKREKQVAVVPDMGNGVIISRYEITITGANPASKMMMFADWKQIEEKEF